jgi:hypothetical protein
VILIFSGLILAASSSFYTTEEKDTFTDDANYAISRSSQKINLGTEITRFFNRGERLRPYFTPYIVSFYPDQIPPVNFTIVSPNNETTTISYDMSPVASEQGPIPTITNLTVSKIEGLQRTNSSSSKFEAATLESGNYTLILTSSYIELNYLALNKIVTIYHYPYANFLPVGATLMVVGTIFLVLSYSFKSSRKNRKKT